MNAVYLYGTLEDDPETIEGKKGVFTKFVVKHNGSTDKQNASVEFISFGKVAEDAAGLQAGQQVVVQGRFQTGTFKRQDGKSFTKTSVIADQVTLS